MAHKLPVRELLDAGVHFGHQTRRANPKMRPYIYGERNGIHIVNLDITADMFDSAYQVAVDTVANGETILFVGTKRQAQEIMKDEARRANQFFVTNRWLGGMLTNFVTIKKNLARLNDIDKMKVDGRMEAFTKKEQLQISREEEKLLKYVGGIREMKKLPGALFVVDIKKEHIACKEARRLGIPIIAVVDTNCDPDQVDHIVPGNDDAIRAIRLFANKVAEAALEGAQVFEERARSDEGSRKAKADEEAAEEGKAGPKKITRRAKETAEPAESVTPPAGEVQAAAEQTAPAAEKSKEGGEAAQSAEGVAAQTTTEPAEAEKPKEGAEAEKATE